MLREVLGWRMHVEAKVPPYLGSTLALLLLLSGIT